MQNLTALHIGAAMTLATMGVAYTLAMMGSALAIKKPHPTYKITGSTSATPTHSLQNVHTDDMFKMPQFIALGSALVVTASGVFICVYEQRPDHSC